MANGKIEKQRVYLCGFLLEPAATSHQSPWECGHDTGIGKATKAIWPATTKWQTLSGKRLTGLSLSFLYELYPPQHAHTHTFYPHASLPSRAVWLHTLSQDPDFTQSIHCVSGNNPLSPCWWKVEVDGVRSVWRGKREECLAALFGNVVFSFPAVSGQWKSSASLSLPTKSSYWLFRYTRTTCSFKICHTHSLTVRRGGLFFLLLP